jgi:hypothetical protein
MKKVLDNVKKKVYLPTKKTAKIKMSLARCFRDWKAVYLAEIHRKSVKG